MAHHGWGDSLGAHFFLWPFTGTRYPAGFERIKKKKREVSTVAHQDMYPPRVSVRMQVQSLALLSGLRIQCYPELWCRSQMQLGSGIAVAVV